MEVMPLVMVAQIINGKAYLTVHQNQMLHQRIWLHLELQLREYWVN